jgi:hypothetical protein
MNPFGDLHDNPEEPITPQTSTQKAHRAASTKYHTSLNGATPDVKTLRDMQDAAELDRRQKAADECASSKRPDDKHKTRR